MQHRHAPRTEGDIEPATVVVRSPFDNIDEIVSHLNALLQVQYITLFLESPATVGVDGDSARKLLK